jgi:hypothetical protein
MNNNNSKMSTRSAKSWLNSKPGYYKKAPVVAYFAFKKVNNKSKVTLPGFITVFNKNRAIWRKNINN